MTDYHDYHTPKRGERDWHKLLNENFNKLDTDVEIRDREDALSTYDPKAGAKFLATDSGRVYLGTDTEWQEFTSTNEQQGFETVSYGARNGTDALIDIEPFIDALREGFIVGVTNGYQVVIDPRNYSSDSDAFQEANDNLVDNLPSAGATGFVYFPALCPEGSNFEINKTVVFGSPTESAAILPRGWGFVGRQSPLIECTINNGDPMFLVGSRYEDGGSMQAQCAQMGGFAATANGNDAEFLRLESVISFTLTNTYARHFDNDNASGVYVFNGRCFNSYINNTTYAASQMSCPGADVWALRNEGGKEENAPSELLFGPGNSCYANPDKPFNNGLTCDVQSSNIAWGGRIEGAGGDGLVAFTSGSVHLTGYTELNRVESKDGSPTDKVYFSGYEISMSPSMHESSTNRTGGHTIHLDGASRARIMPWPDIEHDGDAVHCPEDGGGSNLIVVPYESTLNGSCTYPEPSWSNTVYLDGWKRFREGVTEIKANEVTELNRYAGDLGTQVRLANFSIISEPSDDTRFQPVWGWRGESNGGQQWVGIEESGGGSFELSWELHKR